MCFFFFSIPWHKPTPYFNQFGFGLILKSKDQLSKSGNSDGSGHVSVYFYNFSKMVKNAILRVFKPHFSRKPDVMDSFWFDDSCSVLKMISETPGAILFVQKKSKFAGLCYYRLNIFIFPRTRRTVL